MGSISFVHSTHTPGFGSALCRYSWVKISVVQQNMGMVRDIGVRELEEDSIEWNSELDQPAQEMGSLSSELRNVVLKELHAKAVELLADLWSKTSSGKS